MIPPPQAGAAIEYTVVEVEAADPDRLARFHAETLGLPVRRADDGWAVAIGSTILRLRRAAPASHPFYHLAFAVPENRIEAARDWLVDRGVEPIAVDGDPVVDFPAWNAHAVYFHDPAGSVLELIARHDLPNADDGPFGPDRLLRIDEVGLPTTDVAALVAELGDRLGARPYGSGSSVFQAVGDAPGLAIVVADGRGWFPTGRPAERHPVAVTLHGAAEAAFGLPGGPYTVTVTPS